MYGFLLTTFNDAEETIKAFNSLKTTIPPGTSYKVCIVDGGSRPEQIDLLRQIGALAEDENGSIKIRPNLSDALNTGINRLLGYYESNIDEFIKGAPSNVEHIIWIHADMRFYDQDWAGKLCWVYDRLYPLFGRLAPGTRNIDGSHPGQPLRGGNSCPWVYGCEAIRKLLQKYGSVYSPEYINIGGREDWDNGKRLVECGYGFGICSLMDVQHEGMGTRKLRDTNADAIHNANVYHSHWNTWNEPGFEMDLTDIGNELKVEFENQYKQVWYKPSEELIAHE